MKRLTRIPFAMFLGLVLAVPLAGSAQAAQVRLIDVRIGDRCVPGGDLGYDRLVLDVSGRVKDVSAAVDGDVLTVTSNVPVGDGNFGAVNDELANPEWVFSYVGAEGTTLSLTLTERIPSEGPVFIVSVLKGAFPEGGANQSRLVIDVYESEPDACVAG